MNFEGLSEESRFEEFFKECIIHILGKSFVRCGLEFE